MLKLQSTKEPMLESMEIMVAVPTYAQKTPAKVQDQHKKMVRARPLMRVGCIDESCSQCSCGNIIYANSWCCRICLCLQIADLREEVARNNNALKEFEGLLPAERVTAIKVGLLDGDVLCGRTSRVGRAYVLGGAYSKGNRRAAGFHQGAQR